MKADYQETIQSGFCAETVQCQHILVLSVHRFRLAEFSYSPGCIAVRYEDREVVLPGVCMILADNQASIDSLNESMEGNHRCEHGTNQSVTLHNLPALREWLNALLMTLPAGDDSSRDKADAEDMADSFIVQIQAEMAKLDVLFVEGHAAKARAEQRRAN